MQVKIIYTMKILNFMNCCNFKLRILIKEQLLVGGNVYHY